MIIDDIEYYLYIISQRMLNDKCSEVQHTIELGDGDKVKFHIKKLKNPNRGRWDR